MPEDPLNGEVVQFHDYTPSVQIARQMHTKVTWLVTEINDKGTQLGCLLYQIEEDGLYRQLGYDTFGAYIASPDVHLSRSQVYKLIALAKASSPELLRPRPENVDKLPQQPLFSREDVADMGIERAIMVLPMIRREPEKAQDWVATAKSLGATDLALAIREQREPTFTQVQEAAFELGRKLAAIGFHLKGTQHNPIPIVLESLMVAQGGLKYLQEIVMGGPYTVEVHDWFSYVVKDSDGNAVEYGDQYWPQAGDAEDFGRQAAREWEAQDVRDGKDPAAAHPAAVHGTGAAGDDAVCPGGSPDVSGGDLGAQPPDGALPGVALDP